MRGDLFKGAVLIGVVLFLVLTPTGRGWIDGSVDWVSDVATAWGEDRVDEVQERQRLRDLPVGNCGSMEPLEEGLISERQAVGFAADAWRMKRVPCARLSTELLSDPEQARWALRFEERDGCELNAVIDAETGKRLSVGSGCY